jgi:hypothetical protein
MTGSMVSYRDSPTPTHASLAMSTHASAQEWVFERKGMLRYTLTIMMHASEYTTRETFCVFARALCTSPAITTGRHGPVHASQPVLLH